MEPAYIKDFAQDLHTISISLDKLNAIFAAYQSNITNQPWFQFILGAVVTFLVSFSLEYFKNKKIRKDYIYYIERVVVDQINLILDARQTIIKFKDVRLNDLIKNVENNSNDDYSTDIVFFPKFSVRPLPDQINFTSSNSGYIDNKVAKVFAISMDMPHIMDDMRLQLSETLQKNDKIAFGKLNPPNVQKEQYIRNIEAYKKMIKEDLLEHNIPVYLKKLVETLVAVREKNRLSSLAWKLKFDPRYQFYFKKLDYMMARENYIENMDNFFKSHVNVELTRIEENRSQ